MKTLYIVPSTHIHQFWHLAEPHLQKAIDVSYGEFNIHQLKQFVAQGQSDLLLVLDEDQKCHCALTVQWINYPNDRVAYINYIGGQTNKKCWEQFVSWVKKHGGTKIQGSTKLDGIVRLWRIKWGMQPKYTLMELKL